MHFIWTCAGSRRYNLPVAWRRPFMLNNMPVWCVFVVMQALPRCHCVLSYTFVLPSSFSYLYYSHYYYPLLLLLLYMPTCMFGGFYATLPYPHVFCPTSYPALCLFMLFFYLPQAVCMVFCTLLPCIFTFFILQTLSILLYLCFVYCLLPALHTSVCCFCTYYMYTMGSLFRTTYISYTNLAMLRRPTLYPTPYIYDYHSFYCI